MKKFLIDQLIFLLAGIAIAMAIPFWCGPFFTIISECLVMFSWGYLCRRILLLPFDLIIGKATKTAFFSAHYGGENYEFFKGNACIQCKFYYGGDQTITLCMPSSANENSPIPMKNRELTILYYRLSKILLRWDYK